MVHISELTWWINLIFVLLESLLQKRGLFVKFEIFDYPPYPKPPLAGPKMSQIEDFGGFWAKKVERMVWKHVSLGAKLNGHDPLTHF